MALQTIQATFGAAELIIALTFLSSWVFFGIKLSRDLKKERRKQDEKYVLQTSHDKDLKAMEKNIDSVSKTIETNRKENLDAHKEIKEDIRGDLKEHFNIFTKSLNTRFDDFEKHFDQRIKDVKSA